MQELIPILLAHHLRGNNIYIVLVYYVQSHIGFTLKVLFRIYPSFMLIKSPPFDLHELSALENVL